MLRVQDWLPYNHAGSATTQQNSLVIGTQFGDDGALYMARYPVTCCRNNTSANSHGADRQDHVRRLRGDGRADHDRDARTRRRPAPAGRTPAR